MVTVAQLVEHRFVVPTVAGSSPVSHPMKVIKKRSLRPLFLSLHVPYPSNLVPANMVALQYRNKRFV